MSNVSRKKLAIPQFTISDNILSYGDSFLLISNLVKVEADEYSEPFPPKAIVCYALGFIAFFLPIPIVSMLAGVLLLLAAIVSSIIWATNRGGYYLNLYLSNGQILSFAFYGSGFLHSSLNEIKRCAATRQGQVTIDMKNSNIIYGNNGPTITNANINNSNIGSSQSVISNGESSVVNSPVMSLNYNWEEISTSLRSVANRLPLENDSDKKIVQEAARLSEKEDKSSFINWIKKYAGVFTSNVFSGLAVEALKLLINNILGS